MTALLDRSDTATLAAPDRPLGLWRFGALGFAATSAVVAGAIAGGKSFVSTIPGAWYFGTPGGPMGSVSPDSGHPSAVAMLGVYGGLLLLAVVWWRLVRALDLRRGASIARVVGVVAIWAVPLLLAPPLFSRDVFSYAGQGEMVSHHINPYLYGTGVLGATRFTDLAGPLWANTPSPYGPVFLWLDGLATSIAGHQVLTDLILLRLLAVAGVALIAVGLPTLARAHGRDPASAVVFGAGSPLVLTSLVAGDHNDALMVGLLVAGLAVARRVGPVPGIVVCALAAGVKAPALLGVGFLGWNWAGAAAPAWQRIRRATLAVAIAGVTLAAASWATGIGWGWIRTVSAEDKVHTGVTPVDAVARLVAVVADGIGLGWSMTGVRAVFATLGLVAAAAAGAWLLWHSPRLGMVRSLGWSLLLLALLAPVLWGWYLTWGLVVLAPVVAGRTRKALAAFTGLEAMIGAASVIGILRTLVQTPLAEDALFLGGMGLVAALCVAYAGEERRVPWPPWASWASWASSSPVLAEWVPWSRQRAVQPVGVTETAIQSPQRVQ